MATVKEPITLVDVEGAARQTESRGLLRVLGVVFGLAVTVGITIGMGILRTPGDVAKQLPNPWLFIGAWLVGGLLFYIVYRTTTAEDLYAWLDRHASP